MRASYGDRLLVIVHDLTEQFCAGQCWNCQVLTYGLTPSDSYYADNIAFNTEGCANFTLMQQGTTIGTISLNVPGEHNVLNAVAASALALELKLPFRSIQTALNNNYSLNFVTLFVDLQS